MRLPPASASLTAARNATAIAIGRRTLEQARSATSTSATSSASARNIFILNYAAGADQIRALLK